MADNATAHQVVRAAVGAAGGVSKVAEHFGISAASVSGWLDRGSVPAGRIKALCDLGGNVVTPMQVLDALAREARAAA
ncbi:MAG: YdaS family helix-turn-helix protein [Betaproteobacteria bacterium]|jgi:transposase-like protein